MRSHRIITTTLIAGAVLTATAIPAAADHTHVRAVGNDGQCVVLAEGSGEADVQLPGYARYPENRQHPLHVKVHLGAAGTRHGEPVVWVQGSEGATTNCASYVNR